jgi:hypothetical protein
VVDGQTQKRLAARFGEAVDLVLQSGADIAVNIDGDLQFNPQDIPLLVEPIISQEYNFVAADRFTDSATGKPRRPKGMPVGKYYANKLGAWVVGMLSGQMFNDVTCGFRAYSREALLAINLNSKYTYTQESFQILAVKRKSIKTIPVTVKYYAGRRSRVVTNFFGFLFGSALNILRAYRDFKPLGFFGVLGLVPFVVGALVTGFFFAHWLVTGSFSPYKFLGFAGLYLITLAIIFWALGLVADMFSRILNNQEKILELTKEIKYQKTDK